MPCLLKDGKKRQFLPDEKAAPLLVCSRVRGQLLPAEQAGNRSRRKQSQALVACAWSRSSVTLHFVHFNNKNHIALSRAGAASALTGMRSQVRG